MFSVMCSYNKHEKILLHSKEGYHKAPAGSRDLEEMSKNCCQLRRYIHFWHRRIMKIVNAASLEFPVRVRQPARLAPGHCAGLPCLLLGYVRQSFSGKFSVMRWSAWSSTTTLISNSVKRRERAYKHLHWAEAKCQQHHRHGKVWQWVNIQTSQSVVSLCTSSKPAKTTILIWLPL